MTFKPAGSMSELDPHLRVCPPLNGAWRLCVVLSDFWIATDPPRIDLDERIKMGQRRRGRAE